MTVKAILSDGKGVLIIIIIKNWCYTKFKVNNFLKQQKNVENKKRIWGIKRKLQLISITVKGKNKTKLYKNKLNWTLKNISIKIYNEIYKIIYIKLLYIDEILS